jgi:hypothetical protein
MDKIKKKCIREEKRKESKKDDKEKKIKVKKIQRTLGNMAL